VQGKLSATAAAQRPRRKHDDGAQKLQDSANGNANNAEGKQNKPYQGIQHQGKQCNRPAQDEEDAPQDKSHRIPHGPDYGTASVKVPFYLCSALLLSGGKANARWSKTKARPLR